MKNYKTMTNSIDRILTSINSLRSKYRSTDLCGKLKKYTCGAAGAFNCCSAGGIEDIGSFPFTYGRKNQFDMFGLYAGNQCTSMALTAIIQHKIYSEFTPRTINKILKEGNKLHTRLREDIVLSDNSDNRVAVEDFPHEDYIDIGKVFGRNTHVRMREPRRGVFTTGRDDFVDFLTIREYLESWYTMACLRKMGFLLTIHAFSYAILINKNGVVMFDSHGHLKHKGEAIKSKAGAIMFPSAAELEEFLVGMYGVGRHAVIAPVCVSYKEKATQPDKVERKKKSLKEVLYQPLLLTARNVRNIRNRKVHAETNNYEYDESPFVGMFGGGN